MQLVESLAALITTCVGVSNSNWLKTSQVSIERAHADTQAINRMTLYSLRAWSRFKSAEGYECSALQLQPPQQHWREKLRPSIGENEFCVARSGRLAMPARSPFCAQFAQMLRSPPMAHFSTQWPSSIRRTYHMLARRQLARDGRHIVYAARCALRPTELAAMDKLKKFLCIELMKWWCAQIKTLLRHWALLAEIQLLD